MTYRIVTQKRLKKLLHYNPETGDFTRLRPVFNSIKIGDIAGTIDQTGYIHIKVDRRVYQAHRLAFLFITGNFPVKEIDHVNHIKCDNRWVNLREVTHTINNKNTSMRSDNTSGFMGVHWHKLSGKWQAQIRVNSKVRHLGLFTTKFAAAYARHDANIKYGFHRNHGKNAHLPKEVM